MHMRHLLLLIVSAITATWCQAQTIRIGTDSGYVSAGVSDVPLKHVRADREYHWVRSQSLMVTRGGVGGAVLDGAFCAYHPNGQLREQGELRGGLKHGEWKTWDRSGRSMISARWYQGLRHGPEIHYAADGSITGRSRYRKGVPLPTAAKRGSLWKKKGARAAPVERTDAQKEQPKRNVGEGRKKEPKARKPRPVREAKPAKP